MFTLDLGLPWKIRCIRCGHRGEVRAATAELAARPLRCSACRHVQHFAPESVMSSRRAVRPRRGRVMRRPATLSAGQTTSPGATVMPDVVLDDPISDLFQAAGS
jgi:hypothetical protein